MNYQVILTNAGPSRINTARTIVNFCHNCVPPIKESLAGALKKVSSLPAKLPYLPYDLCSDLWAELIKVGAEATLQAESGPSRYSSRRKELLSSKVFQGHMTALMAIYIAESIIEDGPGWAGKFGNVEGIAMDFTEFVTNLEGRVK